MVYPTFDSILTASEPIYGFMRPEEAAFILTTAQRKLDSGDPPHDWVEIGSWCGKSTMLWASMLKGTSIKLHAIDPHSGVLSHATLHESGRLDSAYEEVTPSTLGVFKDTLTKFRLTEQVVTVVKASTDVDWHAPIGLIFIDGLHAYENVKADYEHFAPHFDEHTWVIFHDYDWIGPYRLIHEKLDAGELVWFDRVASLVVTRYLPREAV